MCDYLYGTVQGWAIASMSWHEFCLYTLMTLHMNGNLWSQTHS